MDVRATIIIPAYNEQEAISTTVAEVKELGAEYRVLVVDDGSADETAVRAKEAGAEVISHPYNKGYGAALKTGIHRASSDVVVIFDADAQHDPNDIPRMVEMLKTYDLVSGDRGKDIETSPTRKPGKWLLGKVADLLADHTIADLNCGFRCFRRDMARHFFPILPNGFSFSTTQILAYYKEGLSVGFIPTTTRKRAHGKSEVKFIRDGLKTLLLIARITALFNPLKIFAPVGGFAILLGLAYGMYSVATAMDIPDGAVLAILFGLILLFFGVLADQIACIRRTLK